MDNSILTQEEADVLVSIITNERIRNIVGGSFGIKEYATSDVEVDCEKKLLEGGYKYYGFDYHNIDNMVTRTGKAWKIGQNIKEDLQPFGKLLMLDEDLINERYSIILTECSMATEDRNIVQGIIDDIIGKEYPYMYCSGQGTTILIISQKLNNQITQSM